MDTILQPDRTILDPGITLRFARWEDLNPVTQLIYDVCEADGDTTVAVTTEELKLEWQTPGFNIETDCIVAVTADGRVVGYEEFSNELEHFKLRTDGYVHPEFTGLGIGTSMMRAIEERARREVDLAEPGVRVHIRGMLDGHDRNGRNIYEDEGYRLIRYSWRMEIVLDDPPPAVSFPEGLELRPFVRGRHDRAVWQAMNESFRDHWSAHDTPFDEWQRQKIDRSDFDPSLWMIVWDGDQIAGISLNRYRLDIGWISNLGVRRPWRKRGLGYALLLHSIGEFYKRGTRTIGLVVDAQNPTGATRLYQKAGMHTASEFVMYEKELRPGREPDGLE